MEKMCLKIVLLLVFIGLLCSSLVGLDRIIYIWDGAGTRASFPHPDSASYEIRPKDAWVEAIDKINADDGSLYAMRDNLVCYSGTDFPTMLNEYHVIILSLGWQGSDALNLDSSKRAQLVEFLDSTGRVPSSQTALIIEGNDFAALYADTGSFYAGTFADYVGAVLLTDDMGTPSQLMGEEGSLAEGLTFGYANVPGTGPCTSMDDVGTNDALWDKHHLSYLFNASVKSPARGIQRRSYSPGATVLLAFQFGNIPSGGACNKEHLLARILDFCVMPLPEIITDFGEVILQVDSTYNFEYTVYDNRCVTEAVIEYSVDNGENWLPLETVQYPAMDTTLTFNFTVPPGASSNSYIRIFATDSVDNYTADTVQIRTSGIGEGVPLPENQSIAAYPNPFNATVALSVEANTESVISIYDLDGRRVAKLNVPGGKNTVYWNGTGSNSEGLPAGIYLARLSGSNKVAKLVLLK